jgi:hypothetical protein
MPRITVNPATEKFVTLIADQVKSKSYSRAQVENVIRLELLQMPSLIARGPMFGRVAENRARAKEIGGLAKKLRRTITTLPPGADRAFFLIASRTWPRIDDGAAQTFKRNFVDRLDDVLIACAVVLHEESDVGDYHRWDHEKQLCAGCALDLIVGLDAGPPTNSTPDSPIRVISALLFKALLPQRFKQHQSKKGGEPDLRDQCAEVHKVWGQMPAEQRQARVERLRQSWTLAFRE